MTLREKLESLKTEDNQLKTYVIDYFLENCETEYIKTSMEDLQRHGCVSGMINSLIYYNDTVEFFEKYKEQINKLASEAIESTGTNSVFELIPKLEKDDPLILDSCNKNIMAWFGFEETAYNLYSEVFESDEIYDEVKKLTILYKEMNKRPKVMEVEDTLEAKQKLVGGLIEVVPYKDNMLLICNEEGKILNMKANLVFEYDTINGDCFIIGDDEETGDFRSLTDDEITTAKKDLLARMVIEKDFSQEDEDMEV